MFPGLFRTASLVTALSAPLASAPASPGWRFRAEAAAQVQHDSNVFLQNSGPAAPSAPAGAPARADTLVGTLGAGLGFTSPATPAGRLSLDYRADLVRYRDFASEDHDDHRVRAGLAGESEAWSWEAGGAFLLTDGSDLGPGYFRQGGGPALGGEPVRARRDQSGTKAHARLTRRLAQGWWRATAAHLYQDFDTRFDPAAAPYVDRGESLAGLDLARDLRPGGLALVAGVRAGRQTEGDRPPMKNLNSSSTLVRALVGLEGAASKTLKLDLRAGPDFRHHPHHPATLDSRRVSPYVEAAATWTPTSTDTVALGGKHWVWLCSSGRGAYEDSTWEVTWKHRHSERLNTRAGARFATGDSRDFVYPGASRFRDFITTLTVAADYRLAPGTVLEATLAWEEGDSRLPDRPGREYARLLAGLGVTRRW